MARKRRVNLRAILADPDLRRELMVTTVQATQAREGIKTTREQAERAYYVVTEGENAAFFDLERFRSRAGEPDRRHEIFVKALREEVGRVRFNVARRDFTTIEGSPLAYRHIGLVAHVFRENTPLEPKWGIAAQGLATAADKRFVRFYWEMTEDKIGEQKEWVPFAKGGDFSRFYADINLIVQWTRQSIAIMKDIGRVQNVNHYFKAGLTWPLRTQRGFNLRVLPKGCIFGHKGPAIFPSNDDEYFFLLGISSSSIAEFILQGLSSFGSWEVGVIKKLPIPELVSGQNIRISDQARAIHDAKAFWDEGNEVSTRFRLPWLLREDIISRNVPISTRLEILLEFEAAEEARIRKLYKELNDDSYRLYGIPKEIRAIIEDILGERPLEVLWPQLEGKTPEQKKMEHIWRLLSYAVKRVVEKDEDGIVPYYPVSGEAGLLERIYAEFSLLLPELEAGQVEAEIANELRKPVSGFRKAESIGWWLENVFFDYHCSLYKNRPRIWHIASSRGSTPFAFGALVLCHRFDRNRMAKLRAHYIRDAVETFKREAALADKEGRVGDRMEWQARLEQVEELDVRLQWVQEGRHEGLEGGESDYRILAPWKTLEKQPSGWEPDINDGVKVNIAPLSKAGVLRSTKAMR